MLLNFKVFLSLLLALGLVACPDDEDEKKDDYSLKVGSIDNVEAGKEFSVPVEVHKDSKVVTEGDGATLKVTVAVTCKAKDTADTAARTEVKPDAKKAASGKVTITGEAHSTWKPEDTCTAKATADGAKEASGTFEIVAAGPAEEEEEVAEKTVAFDPASPKLGEEFKITNGATKNIKLASTGCDNSKLYKFVDGSTPKTLEEPAANYTIKDGDAFFVRGEDSCKVIVAGIDGEKTLGPEVVADAVAVTSLTFTGDNVVLNFAATNAADRASPMLFVKKGTGSWEHATIASNTWTNTSRTLDSGIAKDSVNANNHVFLRTNGHWRYAVGVN